MNDAEKNKPKRVASAGGAPLHFVGDAGVSPADVSLVDDSSEIITSTAVYVCNKHASQYLDFSFDGGTDYFRLEAGQAMRFDVQTSTVKVLGEGASTSYGLLVTH